MTRCRQAVILAAGKSRRLMPLTAHAPKCLLEVSGRSILDRLLDGLEHLAIDEVIVVIGHGRDAVVARLAAERRPFAVTTVDNPRFDSTNNIVSLLAAAPGIHSSFVLLESDVVCHPALLTLLAEPDRMLVSRHDPSMTGTTVEVDGANRVRRIFTSARPPHRRRIFKTVNLSSLSRGAWQAEVRPALSRLVDAGRTDEFYEAAVADALNAGTIELGAVQVSAGGWVEIDDHRDLARAQTMAFDVELAAPRETSVG